MGIFTWVLQSETGIRGRTGRAGKGLQNPNTHLKAGKEGVRGRGCAISISYVLVPMVSGNGGMVTRLGATSPLLSFGPGGVALAEVRDGADCVRESARSTIPSNIGIKESAATG